MKNEECDSPLRDDKGVEERLYTGTSLFFSPFFILHSSFFILNFNSPFLQMAGCKYILVLLFVWLGCSCQGPVVGIDEQLERAELLLTLSPDSSMALLNSIVPSDLVTPRQQALYALLYSEAGDKTYRPVTTDSLIAIATDYFDHTNDYDRRGRAWYYRGIIHYDTGKLQSALKYLRKAMREAVSAKNKETEMLIRNRICMLYEQEGMYKQALEEGLKGVEHGIREQDTVNLPYLMQNLASVYIMNEQFDSTLWWQKRGLEIALNSKRHRAIADLYSGIAATFIHTGELDSAIIYCRNAFPYYTEITPTAKNIMGWGFLGINRYDSAFHYFSSAIKQGDLSIKQSALSGLSRLEEEHGNYREALTYYKQSTILLDSLTAGAHTSEIVALSSQYQESIRRQEKMILIFTFAFLILILSTVFSIRKNRLKIKYLSQKLELEQVKSSRINTEKDLRFEKEKKGKMVEERLKESSICQILMEQEQELSQDQIDQLWSIFDSLDDQFTQRLLEQAPRLRPTEITTCCLLKISFGSAKIAKLRGIDPHSVPRCKKTIASKLDIPTENGALELFLLTF